MTASQIIQKYISFFQKHGHRKIENSPLVPNDPSTLFTSAGMQPLIPYLLGEQHPDGTKLVNVQNCFRAVDIEEVGDNRHGTFFRMLGNWSLGDPASPDGIGQGEYFKKEEIPWLWEFLTSELGLAKERLYITVFQGYKDLPKDTEAAQIWKAVLTKAELNPDERIFYYDDNWWSRSGGPDKMPAGEPGGPDTEVFYKFDVEHKPEFGEKCHPNCQCGAFMEIANSVFMQYQKQEDGTFKDLPQKNVDFGGGLERQLCAVNNNPDVFQTSLFAPIIKAIEQETGKKYESYKKEMRIIADHFISASFLIASSVHPSNKTQGYVLRRLIRRAVDNAQGIQVKSVEPILQAIAQQYKESDPEITEQFEKVKFTILSEEKSYRQTLSNAKSFIQKRYKQVGDELMGTKEIAAEDAFTLYTTHGLSPTQIKSLGYTFDEQAFAEKMEQHQTQSKKGSSQKFERKPQKS